MLICVGGQVATVFINPICWLILLAWAYFQWPIVYVHSPYTLVLFGISLALFQFNILFMCIHMLAALRRRQYALAVYALFLPIYWLFISLGAWRGVFEFFCSPYKWVKSEHGLSKHNAYEAVAIKNLAASEDDKQQSAYVVGSFHQGFFHKLCII